MTRPAPLPRLSPMRTFDPVRLGNAEADAWVSYYQRRWFAVLRASVVLVRAGFGLSWARSLQGAWYVLHGNQLWAPFPNNDPDGAREQMRRFYALVHRIHQESFDVEEDARLEIGWWRAHREMQHPDAYPDATQERLVDALAALYAHLYAVPVGSVRAAAQGRADAMAVSDDWVGAGCDPRSPAIEAERQALVRGYAALRAAVGPS